MFSVTLLGAGRLDHTVLYFVGLVVLDTGIDSVDHCLAVIWVNGTKKIVISGFQLTLGITK